MTDDPKPADQPNTLPAPAPELSDREHEVLEQLVVQLRRSSPPPNLSERVRELIEQHPSRLDLELAAKQAAEILRGEARDKRIEETHAMVLKCATREDLDKASLAQTTEILTTVRAVAKNPLVRAIAYALGGLLLQMIGAATAYFALKGH